MTIYDELVRAAVADGPKTAREISSVTRLPLGVVEVVIARLHHACRLFGTGDGRYTTERPAPDETPAERW